MGRGGGGGGGGGGGFHGGGGGGHIGGGFSGGRVGGSSHSSGSSWGGSSRSSGSSWGGSSRSSGGNTYHYHYNSGSSGGGLFPPLWWWIWGGGTTRNNNYNNLRWQQQNNNNNGGGQDPRQPQKKEPEKKKTTAVGCLSVILIILAIILAFTTIAGFNSAKNAKNRVKLDKKVSVDIGYLDDQLGWIDKKSTVERGMKSFYDQTNVMPYLIITDDIDGTNVNDKTAIQTYAESVYRQLFGSDDTHFLVLWYQENGSDDYAFMFADTAAFGVIDYDAQDVVMNYFNRYYTSDYDDNQYFAKVFEDSAEEIMKQSDSGWKSTLGMLILVIAVLIVMNIIDYKNTMKIKKQEAAAKILNANIEDPGWKDEAEDLSEKYTDEASELASKYENNKN